MPNIVYVLTNPAMPGIVKIGMTDQPDVQARMRQLYSTGVPLPFECVVARRVDDRSASDIEAALHTAFDPYRVNPSREFFEIESEQAAVLLRVMPGRDVTPGSLQQAAGLEEGDLEATATFKKRRAKLTKDEFLALLDGNGLYVYESMLTWAEREGLLINWGTTSFYLRVSSNSDTVGICEAYRSPNFREQTIWTYFRRDLERTGVTESAVDSLEQKALDTGLFSPAGRVGALKCPIDRRLTEAELGALINWLSLVVQSIRESETGLDADGSTMLGHDRLGSHLPSGEAS